ncbi:MAG: SUMF1/EgtB/PvdO family nonheme iron enzyme, partial [Chloroflexota bacterium]
MTKFFITHSWKDIEFARRLFADLTAHGLEGWLDDATLQGGHRLAEEINKGLEWCDVYIPILSKAALGSSWCWEEINAAIALFNKKKRQGRPRVVPVLAEDCEDDLPAVLAARRYFAFTNRYDDALKELLTRGFGISLAPPRAQVAAPTAPEILAPPPPKVETPPRAIINIPAGEFVMGEGNDAHKVYVDAFYIARYPVTNAEYKKFVDATKHDVPFVDTDWAKPYNWDRKNRTYPKEREKHPVVLVTWRDAVAYCKWAGGRLPTEAEWEKAASWDEAKKEKRVYPWGKEFDKNKCNSSESGIGGTTPVGKYSPQGDSAYGVADMAGNVWEWCNSLYRGYPYRADDGREDAQSDGARVVR